MSVRALDVNGITNSFLFQYVWPNVWTSPDVSTSNPWICKPSILSAVNSVVVWFLINPSYPIFNTSTVLYSLVLLSLVYAILRSPNKSIADLPADVTSLPGVR